MLNFKVITFHFGKKDTEMIHPLEWTNLQLSHMDATLLIVITFNSHIALLNIR